MSQMRYRKPSAKTVLGLTKWKKRVKKALGLNRLMWPFRAVGNYKRRVLRRAGYYTPPMKAARAMQRGQVAGPLGPLQVGEPAEKGQAGGGNSLLMAAMLSQQTGDKSAHGNHEPNDNSLLMAAALTQGHKEGEEGGSNLGEALLLASALKGSHAEPTPPKKRPRAKAAQPKNATEQDSHAPKARAKRAAPREQPAEDAAPEAKPKRRRGGHILGVVLVALVTAAAILAVWYFLLA